MAGASPLLTNRLVGVLGDALKVAIAAMATLWIEPWTASTFSAAPTAVRYLIAAVIAAVVLEFLLQIVLGWPTIKIEWTDKLASAPISEVRATVRPSSSESQVFHLDISTASAGWVGNQALRLLFRTGATLNIQIERALVVPTCESSSKDGTGSSGVPTVTANDPLNGFSVRLGQAPLHPGIWHYADVRWRNESTPLGTEFHINYLFDHSKPAVKMLLNLIRRSTNANRFRVVGH